MSLLLTMVPPSHVGFHELLLLFSQLRLTWASGLLPAPLEGSVSPWSKSEDSKVLEETVEKL